MLLCVCSALHACKCVSVCVCVCVGGGGGLDVHKTCRWEHVILNTPKQLKLTSESAEAPVSENVGGSSSFI